MPLFNTFTRGVASVFDAEVFDRTVDGKPSMKLALEFVKANPDQFALVIADLKGDPRLTEKANDDYNGDFSMVKDMVRGTISVPDASRIDDVLEVLENAGLQLATPPKDRINSPGPDGYRDIKLNVIMPNGHIAELQVMTHHMMEAKMILGHALYGEIRPLVSQLERERRTPTPDEQIRLDENLRRQKLEIYDPAWEKDLVVRVGA
jgi:hypothetical protein